MTDEIWNSTRRVLYFLPVCRSEQSAVVSPGAGMRRTAARHGKDLSLLCRLHAPHTNLHFVWGIAWGNKPRCIPPSSKSQDSAFALFRNGDHFFEAANRVLVRCSKRRPTQPCQDLLVIWCSTCRAIVSVSPRCLGCCFGRHRPLHTLRHHVTLSCTIPKLRSSVVLFAWHACRCVGVSPAQASEFPEFFARNSFGGDRNDGDLRRKRGDTYVHSDTKIIFLRLVLMLRDRGVWHWVSQAR